VSFLPRAICRNHHIDRLSSPARSDKAPAVLLPQTSHNESGWINPACTDVADRGIRCQSRFLVSSISHYDCGLMLRRPVHEMADQVLKCGLGPIVGFRWSITGGFFNFKSSRTTCCNVNPKVISCNSVQIDLVDLLQFRRHSASLLSSRISG
jgi:hypothetical protein